METYNRYQHCGETFYTGTQITEIICSECEQQITYKDVVQTKQPIAQQDEITINKIIRQNDTE